MGEDPNADEDIAIRDPIFNNPPDWGVGPGWVLNTPDADWTWPGFPLGSIVQINHPIIEGNLYVLTFTLANANFANAFGGFTVQVGGGQDAGPFRTNGIHSAAVIADNPGGTLGWSPNILTQAGDSCDLTGPVILTEGSYLASVGIDWPEERKTEFYKAAGADYWQILASRNGATHCRVLYDRP